MKKTLASLLIMVLIIGMLGVAAAQEGDVAVIKEFSSSEAVVAAGGLVTTQNVRAYDVSAHVPVTAGASSQITTDEVDVDASGFQYLNQWIYSPEKREDGASIFVLWAPKGAASGQFFFIQSIPVDWEGWKLVSLPLENFVRRNSKSNGIYNVKLTDDPDILQTPKTLVYGVNSYLNEGIFPVTGWTSAGYFCVDNVWLANDQCSPFDPVQSELQRHFPVQTFDDVSQLGYSNATVQVVTDPVREGSEASMRFDVSTADVFLETRNLSVYMGNYQYLYTWVYSPKKQDNGATINFQFYSVGDTSVGLYGVPVNWEGWKLVEVPIDGLQVVRGNAEDLWKLRAIRVNINGYANVAGIVKWEENSYFCLDEMWLSTITKDTKVMLKAAALYNQEGLETALCEGVLTPQFQLENVTQEPQNAVIVAAIYREGILEDIRLQELSQIQPGEETFSLEPMTVEDAQGRSVKLLAFQSLQSLSPLPTEGLGIVDTEYFPGLDTEYFPGFVRKAVTLSYDDGPQASDIKMMEMLNAKGLKATFNVNSDRIETNGREIAESFFDAAVSHEIANHSKGHPNYLEVDLETAIASIRDGKQELEEVLGKEIRGFAYPYNRPYGTPNEEPINQYLIEEGAAYARLSTTNGSLAIPQDFLNWQFTCHHNTLANYKEAFYNLPDNGSLQLLSIWGHSWEFDRDSTWDTILAPFLEELEQRKDEIWNPTNIELVDYIQAKNALVITKDSIYNPSDVDVYVTIDGVPTIIQPHQTIY